MGQYDQTVVTATQLVRDFPQVRRMAESGPVHISSHGHAGLVVLSNDAFNDLQRGEDSDSSRLEQKLNTVMESVETMIIILDQDLCFRRVNQRFCETMNVFSAAIVGKSIEDLTRSPSDQFMVHRIRDVHRSGNAEIITHPSWGRPGRTVRITIKPWHGGVAIFSDDITERMQARDRIVADIALDHALNAIPGLGIAMVDSSGRILTGSTGLTKMLGTTDEALVGMKVQKLFDPCCRYLVEEALAQCRLEALRLQVDYLRNGTDRAKCDIIVSTFWNCEHQTCAMIVLHDLQFDANAV